MERLEFPRRNPEIVWRNEKNREKKLLEAQARGEDISDGGTVILIISGMMHQLNLVGGHIWNLCDGTRSIGDICIALGGEFDADPSEVREDVTEFVNDLSERGWLIP